MPNRISDLSLNVYVTSETLERVVQTVREVVDDHLQDRDVFAWRFTLPVDADDPAHAELETRWRAAHPEADPAERGTYEIALSLVGADTELTDADMAQLELHLCQGISGVAGADIPFSIRAMARADVDLDTERERI
ncbi:hypothetical protein F5X71_11995 [Nocardia brasiliensis]|uniref:Uncharacterized protein n=1 Tax=Nocardia brasiliensis TaxID=37326 RepID=A0A6G9XPT7_NOCBR|nr:hypothetical protein F5X71_11995 [Nocardia brasiliensis]